MMIMMMMRMRKQRLCILIQRLLTDNRHCGEECDKMKVAERKRKGGERGKCDIESVM